MGRDITGERFCYHSNIASYPDSWWGEPEYEATTATTWSYMPLLDIHRYLRLHYFLERNFSPPITLQKTQSVVATPESHDDTALFWCVNVSTMHTASYEFLMKPKESARCHQTLSSRVGSGYKTSHTRLTHMYCIKVCIYGDYYRWNQLLLAGSRVRMNS